MPEENSDIPLSEETLHAVERIFRHCSEEMFLYARSWTRSSHDAQEAMMDAFLQFGCALETKEIGGKGENEQIAYLRGIIRNRALDQHRARRRKPELLAGEAILDLWSDRAEMGALHDFHDAARLEEIRDLLDEVRRVIRSMPRKCGDVALLHWIDDLTYEEIAQQLKISKRAAYNRVCKARRILNGLPVESRARRVLTSGRNSDDESV